MLFPRLLTQFLVFFALSMVISGSATAAPPATLSHQGFLRDGSGAPVNGARTITFRLYTSSSGGSPIWQEVHSDATVNYGRFHLILGKSNALTSVDFGQILYLGIEIGSDGEMSPREEFTASPYAIHAIRTTHDTVNSLSCSTNQSIKYDGTAWVCADSAGGGVEAYIRALTTPINVTAASEGDGKVQVTWSAVPGATSYNLYLATETGLTAANYRSKSNGQQVVGVTTPYVQTGLTNDTEYHFALTSVTVVGESEASAAVTATPVSFAGTNTLGMNFVLIPAGTFTMGSPSTESGRGSDEGPQHQVTISQPFSMQTTEVTQGQWQAVMGSNPSSFSSCGTDCPVETVSWNDIQTFLTTINQRGEGTYRLPTEAEWEYAARAGTTTAYSFGESSSSLGSYGWYSSNASSTTHTVASKLPNPWGLYDMHGNVWEWVSDWYSSSYDTSTAATDPQGPGSGSYRVIRGGSWYYSASNLRSASRVNRSPGGRNTDIGFRLLRTYP